MAGIQWRECPLCKKTSGERFIDESLPCLYCNGDSEKALKIKIDEEKKTKLFLRVLTAFFVVIVLMILNI